MTQITTILALVLLIVGLVALGPMLLLWGLNLMNIAVPYTLESWFGAFLVQAFIGTAVSASSKAKK